MNTILYHFSSTGNSLQCARDLGEALGDCQLQAISGLTPGTVRPDATHVGLVFPTYCFGVPRIVVDFVKRIEPRPGTYVFAAITYGGTAGGPAYLLASFLRERGIQLKAGWLIHMPNNYPPVSGAPSARRQEQMFAKAAERLPRIAGVIRDSAPGPIEGWPKLICAPLNGAYRGAMRFFPQADKRFTVNSACTRCGICAKVCPVKNIELSDGRPQWKHNCEHCMACLQWCPPSAINWTRISVGRTRYHHPKIKARDIWS